MDKLTFKKRYIVIFVPFVLIVFLYWLLVSPPGDFPSRSIITVPEGTGLLRLGTRLKNEGVIRSEFGFRTAAIIFGGERILQSGDYYMPHPENAIRIAFRIVHGNKNLAKIRITIPEGFTKSEINDSFDGRFSKFDHNQFLFNAKEGYMFPDTYFLDISSTASTTLSLLLNNFNKKVEPLMVEIKASGHGEEEIINMASILESEGQSEVDRKIIAGILWKRISLGMPLQVDASLGYLTNKTSANLTKADLLTNSPYNTYINKGLPPGPISNPGLESIKAAIHPTDSDYLYFLTDKLGVMHYAKTFDEHKRNKAKYLNN